MEHCHQVLFVGADAVNCLPRWLMVHDAGSRAGLSLAFQVDYTTAVSGSSKFGRPAVRARADEKACTEDVDYSPSKPKLA
jgi:hypothetical protein